MAKQTQLRHISALDVNQRPVEYAPNVERRPVGQIYQFQEQYALLDDDVHDDAVIGCSHVHSQASSRPSCAISIVSIATSFAVAFRAGPSHFAIHPWTKFQRTTSVPSSSRRMIDPFRRSTFPRTTVCRQSHSSRSSVIPRRRTMFEYLVSPGSLRTVRGSPPMRYSMTAVSLSRPPTSLKAARATPSISTRKLKAL